MRADNLEEEVAATRLRLLQHKTMTSIPVFTVQSRFVMNWQLFMTVVLIFCAVFIPYDAGFVVPTCLCTLRLPTSVPRNPPDPFQYPPEPQPLPLRRRTQRHPTHAPPWGGNACRLTSGAGQLTFGINRVLDAIFVSDMIITFNSAVLGASSLDLFPHLFFWGGGLCVS